MLIVDKHTFSTTFAAPPGSAGTCPPAKPLSVPCPTAYPRLVVFADIALGPLCASAMDTGLLVTAHDIWSETATVGIFDKLRSCTAGTPADVSARPATLFDATEFDDLYDLFLLVLLGRWDALLVRRTDNYSLSCSHDGFLTISARDNLVIEKLSSEYSEKGYLAEPGAD